MNRVLISYRPDADGENYGWLELAVEADGFAGAVGFWSHPNWFEDFARDLNAFPIERESPPEVKIHAIQDEEQPAIQLTLTPTNAVGDLSLTVSLSDNYGTKNQVQLTVGASYAWAQRFSDALRGLIEPPHSPVDLTIY